MTQIIQRSFTSGEIAPALRSRADLIKYATGLAKCENFLVRPQGGVYSRPGFRFIGEIGDSTDRCRLIPFSFNTEQTYVLVFENLTMRVIRDGGYVLDGGVPYEIVTPYTTAQLSRLSFAQSADVMTIVHPSHDPRDLSRTADDAWSLDVIDFSSAVGQPIFTSGVSYPVTNAQKTNPCLVSITFTPSIVPWIPAALPFEKGNNIVFASVGGMTELNGDLFQVGNVTASDQVAGTMTFELKNVDAALYTTYTSGGNATLAEGGVSNAGDSAGGGTYTKIYQYVVTAVDADGVESLPSARASISSKSLSTTYGVRLDWGNVTGADHYRIYKDPSVNSLVYGWIGDCNHSVFSDFNKAPLTSDAPPEDRQPFSGSNNRPSVVNYYQQRKVFANTTNEPQTIFTSQTARYNVMRTSTPARDDDAVTFTIAGLEVNEIRHVLSLDSMVLLTSGGEWLTTEGQDGVLSPSTVGVRLQSSNGSSWVPPVVINSTALYLQDKGNRIRDLGYEFTNDKWTGNDLSLMSEHLFDGFEIDEMTYAAEPYSILWCVRSDGALLGLTYQREHQVWGWHIHNTDGFFESVTTISEDGRDAVYVAVRRVVDGNTVRYVERLEARVTSSSAGAFFVDSGLTYDGAAATVISGLDHLEGEAVAVLADGNVVNGLVVASGSITLPIAASVVQVGLPYTPVIETLDIDLGGADVIKGKTVSVAAVMLQVEKSRGGWVGPKKDDGSTGQMVEIKPRYESDDYNSIELKDFKERVTIDPMWSLGGGIRVEQRDPLPLSILAVIPDISLGGV